MKISGSIPLGIVASILSATFLPFSSLTALLLLPMATVSIWRWSLSVRGILPSLLLLWLAFVPATLAWSLSPGLSLPQAAVLLCLPLGWLAGSAFGQRGQLFRLLNYLLPAMLLPLLIWGLLQGPNTITGKPQGPFNDPNTYAAVLNLLSLPLLARYLAEDLGSQVRWMRMGQLSLLASVAFISFLVSSRGATLSLLILLPALLWPARKQPAFGRKMLVLFCSILAAYSGALWVNDGLSVAQRLVETVDGGDPSRLMLMQSAWLMIKEHPWLGTGLGTFRLFYPQHRFPTEVNTGGGWVHNDYLQLWLEAGLPMLLLVTGLVYWVVREIWRNMRTEGREELLRLGYLAGIGAILLQATVNFLFYFALVSLLVGLYLAHLFQGRSAGTASMAVPGNGLDSANRRPLRMAASGYALILGYLLLGQVLVESLLGQSRFIQRTLYSWQLIYPRYQTAYWVSVLAPFHPTPQMIMGHELSDGFFIDGASTGPMLDEALDRMQAARKLAPCYLPYANDALAVIHQGESAKLSPELRLRAKRIIENSLECNARHGLSYYHAGWLCSDENEAMLWWRAGLAASPFLADKLLLATTILAHTTAGQEIALDGLAREMAQMIRAMEANPSQKADQDFWRKAQYKLYWLAGRRSIELVPQPSRQDK